MTKQVLDVQQMQHLQEMGLKLEMNTMLSWIVDDRRKDEPLLCISSEAIDYVDFSHYCIPAYTLQDVLDALPDSVKWADDKKYYLYMDLAVGFIGYDRRELPDMLTGVSFTKIPMIDAAYSMLCWCIENKFVETNKNE